MRTKSGFVLFLSVTTITSAVALGGCIEGEWRHGHASDNEIVFSISQTKLAEGKLSTSVGYEMLDIQSRGWTTYGFRSPDASCWAEKLDTRLGQPRVEGGVAKFQGGLLPAGGIAVVANRADDLVLDAPAWTKASETLTFESKGFAMPDIAPAAMRVPSVDLAITSPAAGAEVALGVNDEPEVTWTPEAGADARESVVASFVTQPADGSRGVELRCFFDRPDGRGRFPRALVQRFADLAGPGEVKGQLRFATHRQLTIYADGGWIVYVVAGVEQRAQPFALRR